MSEEEKERLKEAVKKLKNPSGVGIRKREREEHEREEYERDIKLLNVSKGKDQN